MNTFTVYTIHASMFGTNTYLVKDNATGAAAVIDPGNRTAEIIAQAQQAGAHIELIVNTHGHWDHINGNLPLQKETGAAILIHELDAPMLQRAELNLSGSMCAHPGQGGTAERLLHDGDQIELGESRFTVLHTPGHTRGGICLLGGDTLLSGDTLFKLTCGRIDLPGGSWPDMEQSLARLAKLEGDLRVLPGHEEESSLDFERANNPEIPR